MFVGRPERTDREFSYTSPFSDTSANGIKSHFNQHLDVLLRIGDCILVASTYNMLPFFSTIY